VRAFSTLRAVSAYSRNRDSFEGVFRAGESRVEVDVDAQGRVGVVGGLEGARAMDATLEIICTSSEMPWMLDGVDNLE
jgi:hypothetical protein